MMDKTVPRKYIYFFIACVLIVSLRILLTKQSFPETFLSPKLRSMVGFMATEIKENDIDVEYACSDSETSLGIVNKFAQYETGVKKKSMKLLKRIKRVEKHGPRKKN